ncbi:MAG: hypothetical protein LBR48_02050, partial [Dysgonamonadaceae bacterium]|nr:hypothetical protein [Dysgonamonadaceae bacterium]
IDESDASYTVDPQYDYLYFVSDPIDLTDTSPEANIVFKRGTTRIQTEVRVYHYGYGTAPDPDPDVAPPEYIYGLSDDFTYTISPNNAVQQTFATASPPIATSTPANAVTPPTWNIDYRTNANYRDYSVCSDDGHTVFTGSSSPLSISLSGKIQLYDGNTVYNHYEGIYYTDGYVPIKTNTTSFTGALSAGYNYKLKINISGYDATSL